MQKQYKLYILLSILLLVVFLAHPNYVNADKASSELQTQQVPIHVITENHFAGSTSTFFHEEQQYIYCQMIPCWTK